MFSKTNPRSDYRFEAAVLLCLWIAMIQASLMAAPLQQKAPEVKDQKGSEGAAAKKMVDKGAASGKKGGTEDAPRISLRQITGSPGDSLMIPLYYTPSSASEPLRSLVVDIDYVSNHLKFQKAAAGVIPEDVGVDIAGSVTDGVSDAKGTIRSNLRVSVSLTEKNPQKGLPEGLLVYLLFQVTMDAKPFTIKLTPTVNSAEDLHTPPRKVARISTVPGTVVVEVPDAMPETTCFFFAH
jgi:hypothetical protein